jgi:hypothetical protein
MPYVLTVDQVSSRTDVDRVAPTLRRLSVDTVLPFTRTVGDEFQGVLAEPLSVVQVILDLMREGDWYGGLGIGPVETPLPANSREAGGTASRSWMPASGSSMGFLSLLEAGSRPRRG